VSVVDLADARPRDTDATRFVALFESLAPRNANATPPTASATVSAIAIRMSVD
jgi:hypothetical protein